MFSTVTHIPVVLRVILSRPDETWFSAEALYADYQDFVARTLSSEVFWAKAETQKLLDILVSEKLLLEEDGRYTLISYKDHPSLKAIFAYGNSDMALGEFKHVRNCSFCLEREAFLNQLITRLVSL